MKIDERALELAPLEELGPDEELGPEFAPNYDDPNGAPCVIAIAESGLWIFIVEPNIDDYFQDGKDSFHHVTDDGTFPETIDDVEAGVYRAKTTFQFYPGSYEYPDDSDWEFGLDIDKDHPIYVFATEDGEIDPLADLCRCEACKG